MIKADKTILFLGLVTAVTLFSWIASCTHKADLSEFEEVCFERDVLPVFLNSCAITDCHDGTGESDLVLKNFVQINHAVEPGKPYSSELYKAIIATYGENKMPPDQPLSLENRTKIRLWIEQGAALTICPDTSGISGDYVNLRACFTRDILPVLTSKCGTSGCHDQITHEEGYIFTSYSSTMSAVDPGRPSESKLYEVIKFATGEEKMPPAGNAQLTIAEIDSIGKWIGYGALNEFCGEICDPLAPVTFSADIWPVIQKSCTGCHSGAAPSGSIALTNYTTVAVTAANGKLLNSLKGITVKMPPGGTLSDCRIGQFEKWITEGYLNN